MYRTSTMKRSVAGACVAMLGACAAVDPRPDHAEARSLIQATTGQVDVFDPEAELLTEREIESVIADGLTLDEALRLALLNNRRLQAGFMRLGVRRAEFVQAGLLANPSLSLAFLFPSGGGRTKVQGDLIESVAEIWQLPLRRERARIELGREVLEVSRSAGELVADTKDAYFDSVAARDVRAAAAQGADLARRSLEAVRQQVQGGVATMTEENLALSSALSAELAFRRAEREDVSAKRRLAALLSLEADLLSVSLSDGLPDPIVTEYDREELVMQARASRLDVKAAEAAVRAAETDVKSQRRRTISKLEAGLSFERPESGGTTSFLGGPAGSIELPLFDQNQAQISRAEYRRDELRKEYEALLADVSQSVRSAVDRASAAARTARFVGDELLPQAEAAAALATSAFELGDTTLLPLLESQRAALLARQARVEALLEAAKTRVDVERSAGAPLHVLATGGRAAENSADGER